ncbi:MAG TPA: hypothetical protein VF824_21190 [Thermoanaerobaculia bacterium]|jgi:hypothetical protein
MRSFAILLLLAAACTTTTVPPASTPPPPPDRPENLVVARGVVFDANGGRAAFARVRAWAADPSCVATREPFVVRAGADGSYEVTADVGVGPQYDGCLIVEAASGGAVVKKQTPVRFASGADAPHETLDLYLPRPEPLTRAEAERLIGVVKSALVTRDTAAVEELSLYTDRGREALYTTLGELQRRIRTVLTTALTSERGGRYVYVLSGQREPPVTVTIEQDVRTKIFFE